MSLRTRLIIAFVLMSVVPLSAVTLVSYLSSVHAFELAAQREATQSATDVSRRMEMITADVGRRLDRLFVAGTASPQRPFNPDPQMVRDSVAPLLGDAAALVDRVEFHPAPDVPPVPAVADADSVPIPIPPNPGRGGPGIRRGPRPPDAPDWPGRRRDGRRPDGPPPPGSQVIVMDIPRIVEEATRAATAAGVAAADPKIRSMVEKRIQQELAARQKGLNAMAEALTRESASRREGGLTPVGVEGRNVEVAVQKDGRVIGRANAMLNLDRTLTMILGFARRDQGEIPFAIDRSGALHTPEAADKTHLQAIGVERTALVAAVRDPAAQRRLDHRRAHGPRRHHVRHRAADRRIAARNPPRLGQEPRPRSPRHRPGVPRHHPDLASHDAAPDGADERCPPARGRRLPREGPGAVQGRVRRAGRRLQSDGGRPRAARGAGRRAGADAPRARAVAADSNRDAAAHLAPIGTGRDRRRVDPRARSRRRLLQLLRAPGWPPGAAHRRRLGQRRQRGVADGEHPGHAARAAAARNRSRRACRPSRPGARAEYAGRRLPHVVPGDSRRWTGACCATSTRVTIRSS